MTALSSASRLPAEMDHGSLPDHDLVLVEAYAKFCPGSWSAGKLRACWSELCGLAQSGYIVVSGRHQLKEARCIIDSDVLEYFGVQDVIRNILCGEDGTAVYDARASLAVRSGASASSNRRRLSSPNVERKNAHDWTTAWQNLILHVDSYPKSLAALDRKKLEKLIRERMAAEPDDKSITEHIARNLPKLWKRAGGVVQEIRQRPNPVFMILDEILVSSDDSGCLPLDAKGVSVFLKDIIKSAGLDFEPFSQSEESILEFLREYLPDIWGFLAAGDPGKTPRGVLPGS